MKTCLLLLALFPAVLYGQSLQKAKTLFESGKPAEAAKLLEAINDDSKEYAEAQFYLGRIAYNNKEYDDASDFFEEATEANDKNPLYFEWLGNTYGTIARDANVMRQGFLAPKMKDAWEKAVSLDPKNIGARLSLIEFYVQAPGFMGGSMDKAVETAKQIIKLDAARGHQALANVYDRDKKTIEAEKEYIAMAAADAKYLPILINFYIAKAEYDKAFKLVDAEIQKKPDDMLMMYQYAKLAALSGKNLERGEQYLKKYLSYTPKDNEPSHAGAYMRLGMIYEKRRNKAEAKKNYQTALQLDKKLKEAEEGLARVSK